MMFRLTLLLSVTLFGAMLIGGRDFGQMRPGLAEAKAEARAEEEQTLTSARPARPADAVEIENLVTAAFTPDVAHPEEVALQEPVGGMTLRLPLVEPRVIEAVSAQAPAPDQKALQVSEPDATEVEPGQPPAERIWYVTASNVNVRAGPGTTHEVLGRLSRGEAATVVWADDTGWARIRIEGDGIEGYVFLDFLSEAAP